MKINYTHKKGFTLIELLIVVVILATLAAAAVNEYGQAKSRSRDARRRSDLDSISKAMDMYYLDNKKYPPGTYYDCTSIGWGESGCVWSSAGIGISAYLPNLPLDPLNTYSGGSACNDKNNTYTYSYMHSEWFPPRSVAGAWGYVIATKLENPVISESRYYGSERPPGTPNWGCDAFGNYAVVKGSD